MIPPKSMANCSDKETCAVFFVPFILHRETGMPEYVRIEPAAQPELALTAENHWQTDWESDYLAKPGVDKFALKTSSGELVALGAYQVAGNSTFVYIVYLESAPHSNPTHTPRIGREFSGIGEVMIAFGIKYSIDMGCRGVVAFEAKTDELAKHYSEDFHALEIAGAARGGPRRFMLADEDAWRLFSKYLAEEEKL